MYKQPLATPKVTIKEAGWEVGCISAEVRELRWFANDWQVGIMDHRTRLWREGRRCRNLSDLYSYVHDLAQKVRVM